MMKFLLCIVLLTSLFKLSIFFSISRSWRYLKSHGSNFHSLSRELSALYAKKKKLIISDDFLNTLENSESSNEVIEQSDAVISEEPKSKKSKKKQKQQTENASDDADQSEPQQDDIKLQKNKIVNADIDHDPVIDVSIPVEETKDNKVETIEQKLRRERPPSRVKFAESSQPGYAMLALESVGLVFGNEEILIDSSFSVSTGERVGLVGPNGSGKTTQLKILSGDIIPTTGTVVKSSPNLRVSFLRQEFLDSLNLQNTLRQELYSTFTEEQKLIDDISQCEKDIANAVDSEAKMNEYLDKLQVLQEKAISKGVYSLNSKIEKMMDNMGFSKADADSLISTFSGGWKMRIGLAKILLENPNIVLLDEPVRVA